MVKRHKFGSKVRSRVLFYATYEDENGLHQVRAVDFRLGVGGSSSGFMTARGAADFLTRATSILGALFIILSIGLAALAGVSRTPTKIDTSLANQAAPVTAPGVVPLAPDAAPAPTQPATGNQAEPAVPLAQ